MDRDWILVAFALVLVVVVKGAKRL